MLAGSRPPMSTASGFIRQLIARAGFEPPNAMTEMLVARNVGDPPLVGFEYGRIQAFEVTMISLLTISSVP